MVEPTPATPNVLILRMRRQFCVALVLALPCLIIGFYAEEDFRGWFAWHQFSQRWEAKGEHSDFANLVPTHVPDNLNFALTPVVASCWGQMLNRDGHEINPRNTSPINLLDMDYAVGTTDPFRTHGDWTRGIKTDFGGLQQFYRKLATTTNRFPVPLQPRSPPADVLLALSIFNPVIEDLRRAARLPLSRFPVNYDSNGSAVMILPHLTGLKKTGVVLELRALAELQNGQGDDSIADILLIRRLIDSIATEPFLISHLVRIALEQLMLQTVWEGMADHRWSDRQLLALDASMANLDFVTDYSFAMHAEMGAENGMISRVREHPGEYFKLFDPEGEHARGNSHIYWYLIPQGWYWQNQLVCGVAMEQFYLAAANPRTKIFSPLILEKSRDYVEYQGRHISAFNNLACQLIPGLDNAGRKFAFAQASADLARVAIALERYRLANGIYPSSLAALEPKFQNLLPHDVIGGQPFHYRLNSNHQFILYSIGWNQTDDCGVIALGNTPAHRQDLARGDWVWSYPQP